MQRSRSDRKPAMARRLDHSPHRIIVEGHRALASNAALGTVAQVGRCRFGSWHYMAYAMVFAATILGFHLALLLMLAVLGSVGYLVALATPASGAP